MNFLFLLENSTLTWTDISNNHTYSLSFKKESFRDLILYELYFLFFRYQLKNGCRCNYQNFSPLEIEDEDDDGFAIPDPHPETLSSIYRILCCIPEHAKQFVLDLLIDEVYIFVFILFARMEDIYGF